jgi:hypothetical protein
MRMRGRLVQLLYLTAITVALFGWIWLLVKVALWIFVVH